MLSLALVALVFPLGPWSPNGLLQQRRPSPFLLPLMLAGGTAIALVPPARADAPQPSGVAASLALKGCRTAVGLDATAPPAATPAMP